MCISLSSITNMYDSLVNYAYEKLHFLYLGFSRKFGINNSRTMGLLAIARLPGLLPWIGQIDPFSTPLR